MGSWLERAYSNLFLLLLRVTIIRKLIEKMSLGSYTERTQGLTKYNNNDYGRWGDPWGFPNGPKIAF